MVKTFKEFINEDSEYLFEMANYFKKTHPQLPANMYISPKNADHEARIKVQNNTGVKFQINNMFSIKIHDLSIVGNTGKLEKEDIDYFKRFITKNKDILLKYWNWEIDSSELNNNLDFNC